MGIAADLRPVMAGTPEARGEGIVSSREADAWREEMRERDRVRREEIMRLPALQARHHGTITAMTAMSGSARRSGPPARSSRCGRQPRTPPRRPS